MLRATGPSGALRVGYQWAADLGAWKLTPSEDRPKAFVLNARIIRQHQYWIEQDQLDLALTLGTCEWLWRGVEVIRDGAEVSVILAELPIVSENVVMVNR